MLAATKAVALFFLLSTCFAVPLPPPQKCPSIESNEQLKQLRQPCVQYENATVPPTLSPDTQKQLLCVLYLATYNTACTKNVTIPESVIPQFNFANVCSNLHWVVEGAKTLIPSRIVCQGVCVNEVKGGVLDECSAAFYLDTLAQSAVVDTKTIERAEKTIEAEKPQPPAPVETTPKKKNATDVDNQPQPPPSPPLSANEDVRADHPPEITQEQQEQQLAAEEKKPVVVVTSEKAAEKTSNAADVNSDKDKSPLSNSAVSGVPQQNAEEHREKPQQEVQQSPPAQKPQQQPPQQKQQPPEQQKQQPPEQQNNHIGKGDTNSDTLNAYNETPEEDIKLEDADDMDDDDVDDQGELKYNKPNIDADSDKAPANVPQKPDKTYSSPGVNTQSTVDGDSYFFSYFMMLCIIIVLFYVGYHNKQKIRAIVLEGPRGRRQYRSRRPNSANYHKLDSNLEEAITSSTANKGSSNVIY